MRRLIVHQFISLDGVIQAPGGANENTDGGFTHGGWTIPFWHDDIGMRFSKAMETADTLLLGRKTWKTHGDAFEHLPSEEDPFGNVKKYVVSTTLHPPALFVERLNAFAAASGGGANFYQTAVDAVAAAGIDLNPPPTLLATLLVAPIAWTSLQWATYSAQQNGEIKDARSFKNQTIIIVGSLIVTGILLALIAAGLERLAGPQFLYVAGAGYWSLIPEATVGGFYLWPNIVAIAVTASPIVVLLIGLGYILNSHQIVHNCYIGMTRVMVAMSLDRLLPEWVSKVNSATTRPSTPTWPTSLPASRSSWPTTWCLAGSA